MFDAQMLRAISTALDETATIHSLPVPKNWASVDCLVTCERDGQVLRIAGHAPFDIIIGYGMAGVGNNATVSLNLGPTAASILADAVAMLGWDLAALKERRLTPVLNALYGNALN